jgi:hypothetical protein
MLESATASHHHCGKVTLRLVVIMLVALRLFWPMDPFASPVRMLMVVCGERLARFQTEKWLANSSQPTIIDQSVKTRLQ